jgi:hypothetical protein
MKPKINPVQSTVRSFVRPVNAVAYLNLLRHKWSNRGKPRIIRFTSRESLVHGSE